MPDITTTSMGALLKNLYAPWDIEQLVNLTNPALNACAQKGSAQLGGAGFFFAVRSESAHGHAYIAEDADLPAGLQSTVLQAQVDPTVHTGTRTCTTRLPAG